MIIIQVQMSVKVEERETFLNQAKSLLSATQAEVGNISYNLYEDVSRPGRFIMLEEWQDEQAIDSHNKSEHLIEFFTYARNVLIEPAKMQRMNP